MRFTSSADQLSWVVVDSVVCKRCNKTSKRAGYNNLSLHIFVGWLVGFYVQVILKI